MIETENGNMAVSLDTSRLSSVGDFLDIYRKDWSETSKLAELLEPYTANGWTLIDTYDVSLTREVLIDKYGTIISYGEYWYYEDYVTKNFMDELLSNEKLVLTHSNYSVKAKQDFENECREYERENPEEL
jgi:hypothetical protein